MNEIRRPSSPAGIVRHHDDGDPRYALHLVHRQLDAGVSVEQVLADVGAAVGLEGLQRLAQGRKHRRRLHHGFDAHAPIFKVQVQGGLGRLPLLRGGRFRGSRGRLLLRSLFRDDRGVRGARRRGGRGGLGCVGVHIDHPRLLRRRGLCGAAGRQGQQHHDAQSERRPSCTVHSFPSVLLCFSRSYRRPRSSYRAAATGSCRWSSMSPRSLKYAPSQRVYFSAP